MQRLPKSICDVCDNLLPEHFFGYEDEPDVPLSQILASASTCRYCQVLGNIISVVGLPCCKRRDKCFSTDKVFSYSSPIYPQNGNQTRPTGVRIRLKNDHGFDRMVEFFNMAGTYIGP
jgi:hypothetical protein